MGDTLPGAGPVITGCGPLTCGPGRQASGVGGRACQGAAQVGATSVCSRWWSEDGVGCTRCLSGAKPRRNT